MQTPSVGRRMQAAVPFETTAPIYQFEIDIQTANPVHSVCKDITAYRQYV